ncbi:MAG: helix-turn-helix transcriptional regulator [Actinomycetota bacterium]
MPAPTPQGPTARRTRFQLDEGKRGDVLAMIVASLERAVAAAGTEARQRNGVRGELAGLAATGRQGSPVDIHIRLDRSELELEVVPSGATQHPAGAEEFRSWLLQRLRAEGLSQESAARRIGVSSRTVGRWARGQTQPRMRDLARVREVLGELPAF